MALVVGGTDYVQMPNGTTAQRPTTPAAGMTRYNSTTTLLEYYNGSAWINAGVYSVDSFLIAGGGGGGGYNNGGGGGGGGFVTAASLAVAPGVAYTVTIGAGGAGGSTITGQGVNGSNSSFNNQTAIGGGGGGGYDGGSGGSAGLSGASGGGGERYGRHHR